MKNIYACLFLSFFSIVQTYTQESEPLFDFITIADKYNLDIEEVQCAVERAQRSMQPYSKMIDIKVNNDHTIYHTTRQGVGLLSTKYGHFYLFDFAINDSWYHYFALVKADLDENFTPVFKNPEKITLRIDSGCSTGQLFHEQTCECHEQLESAMQIINQIGEGIIISIPTQDGRGMGTPFKLGTLSLQSEIGLNTVESANLLANSSVIDIRTYSGVISILKFMNITEKSKICIATNNAEKIKPFINNGYTIEHISIVIEPTEYTRHHLEAKKEYLGHTL